MFIVLSRMRVFVIAVVAAFVSGSGNPPTRRKREGDEQYRGKRMARSVTPKLAVYEALCTDPEMSPYQVEAHMLSRQVPVSEFGIGLEAMRSILNQTRMVDWIHDALLSIATQNDIEGNRDRIEGYVQRISRRGAGEEVEAHLNTWSALVVNPMLGGQNTCIVDPLNNIVTMSAAVKRNFICAQYQIEQAKYI